MQVQACITFGGRCEEALAFYKQAVGAEVGTVMADDGMGPRRDGMLTDKFGVPWMVNVGAPTP